MPRSVTIVPHLSVADLHARYRQAHDPVERSHWQIIWLVAQGHRVPDVAETVGYTANWVREIIRRYHTAGPAGLVDQRQFHRGGNPRLLSPDDDDALTAALAGPAPDGGLWTGRKVAAWMADRLGRPVGEVRGWEAMRRLGFTPQRPRPRASTADPAAQAAFKKGGSRPRSTPSRPSTRTPG